MLERFMENVAEHQPTIQCCFFLTAVFFFLPLVFATLTEKFHSLMCTVIYMAEVTKPRFVFVVNTRAACTVAPWLHLCKSIIKCGVNNTMHV